MADAAKQRVRIAQRRLERDSAEGQRECRRGHAARRVRTGGGGHTTTTAPSTRQPMAMPTSR